MDNSDNIDPTMEQFEDFVIQDEADPQQEFGENYTYETDDTFDQSYEETQTASIPSFEPDGEGVLKCGHLDKEGALDLWAARWFVVRTDGLFWYVNKHSRDISGSIPAPELQETLILFPKKDNVPSFGIQTKKKTFYVRAKTEWERCEWITALQRVGCTQQGVPPYFFQPLPQGWETRKDDSGKVYFIDHAHKKSTYEDPRKTASTPSTSPAVTPAASPSKPIARSISTKVIHESEHSPVVPVKHTLSSGHIPKQPPSSPLTPRALPIPIKFQPQPPTSTSTSSSALAPPQLPLPQGWEMRQDNQGRSYFIDHVNKKSTYDDPRYNTQLFPLPNGWELRFDPQGRPYFIDHTNKRSTYDDPRVNTDYTQPPPTSAANTAVLPKGWEMRYDQQGRPYFIDHVNKKSTYDDPRK